MAAELQPWSTTAINLPDHADNAVHTDVGARAAGFDRALVAGTSVYAYMTHPPAAGWGMDWVTGGGGELRLRRPVFDADRVDCVLSAAGEGPRTVRAEVDGEARATLELWERAPAPPARSGERLATLETVIDEVEATYGARCGDDLSLYAERQIVHPVLWPNLANRVFTEQLVTGPWVHVRSRIHHHGAAPLGATVRVESTLIERFDSRAGERALVDMVMYANDTLAATIEHEAIVVLS